jgi:ribosome-binding factor A
MRAPDSSKKGKRPLRVAAEILRDLPGIMRAHIELPLGVMVSVTEVEVNEDLSLAKIFFSVYGEADEAQAIAIERELNAKKGVVRHELAQRLVMRQHPDVRFHYDSTPARAARIEQLLRQVREGGETPPDGESA